MEYDDRPSYTDYTRVTGVTSGTRRQSHQACDALSTIQSWALLGFICSSHYIWQRLTLTAAQRTSAAARLLQTAVAAHSPWSACVAIQATATKPIPSDLSASTAGLVHGPSITQPIRFDNMLPVCSTAVMGRSLNRVCPQRSQKAHDAPTRQRPHLAPQ